MLEEYKEVCRKSADTIPGWMSMSKNDLCRAYVKNKENKSLQNAYMSAILFKYWGLISKYYYQSSNCATPEECYGWLVDSVSCCVNLASWEDPTSSIYKDPNGPDKVINRCMKCARLTYYQFINRKKRKDEFGIASIEELKESLGNAFPEPIDEDEYDVSTLMIQDYITEQFSKKNYFVSFLIYFLLSSNVFDSVQEEDSNISNSEFSIRKMCKVMNTITDENLAAFSAETNIPIEDTKKAFSYIQAIPAGNMRKKIVQTLEHLKHSDFIKSLVGGSNYAH